MSLVRICGYDVNGFRDLAARNWEIAVDGEARECLSVSRGGLLSSVVQAGSGSEMRWIGGAQADLAPHGRGGGWGEIGSETRRIATRDLLAGRKQNADALAAAFIGLVSDARVNVIALNDLAQDTEALQERLLLAARVGRMAGPLLVWRSVLAVLFRLSEGHLFEGRKVGVISHTEDGFALQTMRILSLEGVLAPERRRAASGIASAAGLGNLVMQARRLMLGGEQISTRSAHRPLARMVGSLAMGEVVEPELLRDSNGRWDLLDPVPMPLPNCDIAPASLEGLADCDEIVFESLAAGSVSGEIVDWLRRLMGRDVVHLPIEAVALGALEAARRLRKRAPVYFDFLPQISTIVQTAGRAESFDLVVSGATVEAGKLYRSSEPARFALPARQDSLSVYLRKETVPEPRRATVDIGQPLTQASPVALLVEQKPASGRARILLEAREIGRQFVVDWDEAEILDQDWQCLLDGLDAPKPSIPDRLVLPCHLEAWETGLLDLLESNHNREQVDWASLAQKMRARVIQGYCISSDGMLPSGLDRRHVDLLDGLTERAMAETLARLNGPQQRDNEALSFLTWQFRRCPADLVLILMECLTRPGAHPFVWTAMNWVLIYQGLARIISTPDAEKELLRWLLARPIGDMEWRTKTACIAMILSRSETAPLTLTRDDVDVLARRVLFEFEAVVGNSHNRFLYTRFLLGGLLRWRQVDPYALVPGHDPLGEALIRGVERVLADLVVRRQDPAVAQAERRIRPTYEGLLAELKGEGSSPDLLLNIYQSS